MKYLILIVLMLLFVAAKGHAEKIMISGKLEEPGCNFALAQGAFNSACYRDGQWRHQSQPLADIANGQIVQQTVQTQLIWLDRQQQRGVIIVSYQ